MPSDEIPRRMLALLLELMKSGELPDLVVVGAWCCICDVACMRGSITLARDALESDICGLALDHLHAVGSASDWVVSLCRGACVLHIIIVQPPTAVMTTVCRVRFYVCRASHAAREPGGA
jgi:hypothetical protein